MAHSSMTTKAISSIQECVAELKQSFFTEHTLINDDNPALHRLEEKLELVLSVGLKEKPGVFGGKKSYWDYISACLSSSKRFHQGLKFVKSISELKTSVGRGRAFIRFCLMQNCLADTLQSCLVDKKNTRDFYSELSLPHQPKLWSALVAYLYDLNEIHFDLNPQHAELDVSWPSFARKIFVSSENEVFSGKKLSSNVTSSLMVNEEDINISTESMLKEKTESTQSLVDENTELEANVLCLQKKCETLQKEIFFAVNEENKQTVFTSVSDCIDRFLPQSIPDYEKLNDKYCYEASSLSDSKASSNSFQEEFNFGIKENTQCVCNCSLKKELMDITKSSNESSTFNMPNSTNKLIVEMKELTENLSNSMCKYSKNSEVLSSLTRLKSILDYFETNYISELKKVKEFEVYKQRSEEFANYLKSLALKQNTLIDSLSERVNLLLRENESLYEKMSSLKDRLHSYGLLKIQIDSSPDVKSSFISNDSLHLDSNPEEDFNCVVELDDYTLKDSLDSLNIFKESLSKLGTLNTRAASLQLCLNSSHKLNDNLISRVQDQEIHMKGITKELEEAHHLLSVMRKQHQKLQSAEHIIKYDLQEKRKLLTRLKQQLEATREDCNLVRIKNSKSKSEWESLRKEFALRTKQTSEESGFIDDKGIEDQCAVINTTYDQNIDKVIPNIEICKTIDDVESKYILKKNRLQMLEEQCKLLCSNLVNSSKKREEIDCRLESWCKAIEKSQEVSEPEKLSQVSDTCNEFKRGTEEVASENIGDSGSDLGSSLLSSEIGSVNSDCICIPTNSSSTSSHICFALEPLKTESFISSKNSNLESRQSEIFLECTNLEIYSDSNSNDVCSATNQENLEIMEGVSSFGSIESLEGVEEGSLNSQYASEENSLNSEDGELEKILSCKTRKNLALETEVLKLREEKSVLETKFQELEKTSILLSSQLALKTQQLKLTESAKEQEITALQFQLNSEVLKYERILKEFAANNDGLNDMKQRVNDQEELILALEEALAEIQSERESEKDHQWEQLQDIQLALVAREEECILLSTDLEKLEEFKKYCLNDREVKENEIIRLRKDSKELQKKVIKLLKEKDILWQRNDHLTFLQKIQIDDRWINDNEVSQCIGCRSSFSFLLRKHHCRQCGRIFCNSCSNNWLLTASSKKQIRICNECYMQHLEMKKVVRRDSNVQCCEDSEDEAAVDNASFSRNRHYISENCLSITDSIVSLPVMQETSLTPKCRFTSAPQLYMAVENQKVSNTNSVDYILPSQLETSVTDENRDFLIKAGEEVEIPILNEWNGTSLHWKFTPNNEAIPITLIHENSNLKSQQTVLHHSACETEGVIQLTILGLYKFCFDNTSRSTPMLLNYTFKHTILKESKVCI